MRPRSEAPSRAPSALPNLVVLGKAGVVEHRSYYVTVAERAATAAARRGIRMTVLMDQTSGLIVASACKVSRPHWVIAEITHASDPDVLAASLEREAIAKGFDEGRRRGNPALRRQPPC